MTRRPLAPLAGALLGLAGALGACGGATGPADAIARQREPFYYYEGTPVPLVVDATRLTLEMDGAPAPAVRAAVAAAGVRPDSVTPMPQAAAHWVAWLDAGTSAAAAERAAAALRHAPGVAFASAAYRTRGGTCTMLLVNTLAVLFRPDATREQVAALNARVGTTPAPREYLGFTALRYPAGSDYTPLEVAAFYDRHPLVRWADADRVDCLVLH